MHMYIRRMYVHVHIHTHSLDPRLSFLGSRLKPLLVEPSYESDIGWSVDGAQITIFFPS